MRRPLRAEGIARRLFRGRWRTVRGKARRAVANVGGGIVVGLAVALVVALVIAWWIGSGMALAVAGVLGVAMLAEALHRIRSVYTERRSTQTRCSELRKFQDHIVPWVFNHGRYRDLGYRPPVEFLPYVGRTLLQQGHALDSYHLLADAGSLSAVDIPTLRQLRNALRQRGYLTGAQHVARTLVTVGSDENDSTVARHIDGEIAVLSGEFALSIGTAPDAYESSAGRILHIVGNSLPQTQSGYTLRTHYINRSQHASGLSPHVVTQTGVGDRFNTETLDGITYHRIPGARRGSEPLDRWLSRNAENIARVVEKAQPEVLHAASDFINAMTALAIGRAFGIPVVYESRGFWEETWLSQQAQFFGWNLDRLASVYGLPEAYTWRRDLEDRCRRNSQHVVTLSEVMADRIAAGGVARERISVVPNAVDVDAFPMVHRNEALAAKLGIDSDDLVIGYVSSIVEYEGIDTLIAAYAIARAATPVRLRLVIVGDGPELARLKVQAAKLGVGDAIFAGRVPHDSVLDYYSLIDIFVVPRKPVEVSGLVTPLKPFEAMSTGRAVVLSNVMALARIAEQSGAAELFDAGDEVSLATVLNRLAAEPRRRGELAEKGAAWVRAEATWDANTRIYKDLYQELRRTRSAPTCNTA